MASSGSPIFLITGGRQRPDAAQRAEGSRFERAHLVRMDWPTGSTEVILSREAQQDVYPATNPNVTYTSASLDSGKLYLCTETELFEYSYPALELLRHASYPFLQNVHHIAPIGDVIAVASTGLDLVAILDRKTFRPLELRNALHKPVWHRFSEEVDYRLIHSTKPHEAHPNFVFELEGNIWTTRFNQKDAVALNDPNDRISIDIERPHDGHVVDGYVYFTCVNGIVVVANVRTRKVEAYYDLNRFEGHDEPLGWCRGLAVIGNRIFVGFTRLRPTRIQENLNWLLSRVGGNRPSKTRIVEYDLVSGEKISERILPPGLIDAVYSVLPE